MILAIIKNLDGSLDYIKLENDKLVCDNYSKNGVIRRNDDYIDKFFSILHYNENCVFIEKYKDHDVYFDEKTNLKHFIKNGKENFDLFIKFNTENAMLSGEYDEFEIEDENDIVTEDNEDFKLASPGCIKFFAGTLAIFMAITIFAYEYKKIHPMDGISTTNTSYSTSNRKLNKDEALEYLKNSNLDPQLIDFLTNDELLSDVFRYYEDTPYEYTTLLKFDGLHTEQFEDSNPDILGRYNHLTPNVLYINKSIHNPDKINAVGAHEFVHLLQAEGCNYYYLLEATAELIVYEYYDTKTDSYSSAIENLKLLINAIGPEPIMKLVFANDDTDFKNIIESNLSEYDAYDLIDLLQTKAEDFSYTNSEVHLQIKTLLSRLHKSIYGEDAYYDFIYNQDDSVESYDLMEEPYYYLNWRKMDKSKSVSLVSDATYLCEKGYLKEQNIYKFEHKVNSISEYNEIKKDKDVKFDVMDTVYEDGKNPGTFDYDEYKYYLYDTPINLQDYYEEEGYYYLNNSEYPAGHFIELEEAIQKGLVTVYAEAWSPDTNKYPNWNKTNMSYTYKAIDDRIKIKNGNTSLIQFSITIPSLKDKFPDQYNNLSRSGTKKTK